MKTIKKYHFRFVAIGKGRIYLRYFVTQQGTPLMMSFNCEVTLTKPQLAKLNAGTLGGMIQKQCYELRQKYESAVLMFHSKNSSYPTPKELQQQFVVNEVELKLSYLIHKYLTSINAKKSTKKNYEYVLKQFQQYYEFDTTRMTLKALLSKNTVDNFAKHLIAFKSINQQIDADYEDVPLKKYSPITLHNNKSIVLKFLNYIANLYDVQPIEMTLKAPQYSQKYFLSAEDMQRILDYKPENQIESDVQDICIFNKDIGLRISEVLNIEKENIVVLPDCIEIRFAEAKKNRERTIVVVQHEGIEVLKKHLVLSNLWCFTKYSTFDKHIKIIANKVFKDETTKIYKIDTEDSHYLMQKKADLISSHIFRRFAIENNIVEYGIDVARSYSGHTQYSTLVTHYARFLQASDLKKILLKKR
jgi:integrase